MRIALIAAAAAAFACLGACDSKAPAASAAENGLRKDLAPVAEVLQFRETGSYDRQLPDGKGMVLNFESEVKWLTLEESVVRQGGRADTQAYLSKAEYIASSLGSGPKAGKRELIKGALLLTKTDIGWLYQGLAKR